MGVLYDMKVAVEKSIESGGLDGAQIRGQLGLKIGRLVSLISPSTPDDPVVIGKFRAAAKNILNLNL